MMTYCLYRAVEWLDPIVHLIGLGVAAWAFLRCRKRGYVVVAIYFALAVFSLVAMPGINRMLAQRRTPDLSEQTKQKMNQAMHEAMERVLDEAGHLPIAADMNVNFPLGPILLVTGLWLIARRERATEPPAAPHSGPAVRSPQG